MNITYDQTIANPTEEHLDIHIEWNPKNDDEDGYIAMIHAVIDTVRQLTNMKKDAIIGDP